MFASVITGQVRPGQLDEYLRIWRESIVPAAQQLKGFQGAYVLTDRETDQAMTTPFYESRDDALAVQASGRLQELFALLGATLVGESVVR